MLYLYMYIIIISYSQIKNVYSFHVYCIQSKGQQLLHVSALQNAAGHIRAKQHQTIHLINHVVSKLPVPAWFQFDWSCSWSQACTINMSPLVSSYMCCIPTVDSLCPASHRCTGCPQNFCKHAQQTLKHPASHLVLMLDRVQHLYLDSSKLLVK